MSGMARRVAVGSLVVAIILGGRGAGIEAAPESRACDAGPGLPTYRTKGKELRNGKLVRMRFEVEANLPDGLFPFDDEFPAGVDCAPEPGRIVVTFGKLAEGGTDDSRFEITRSLYRAVGVRFDVVRRARFRIGTDPAATRRWPELRGDPFISCSDRVK